MPILYIYIFSKKTIINNTNALVISQEAPSISPVIHPKDFFELFTIAIPTNTATAIDIKPILKIPIK